jgi:hypothetical protein
VLLLSAGAVIPLIGVFSVPQSCREEHGNHRCQDGCRPFGLKPGEARKYPTCRATTHPRYSLGSLRDPILFFSAGDHRLDRRGLRDICHRRNGATAASHNLTSQPIRCVGVCGIVHAYSRAALRQKPRRCPADASSAARHECYLVSPRSHISPVAYLCRRHTPAEICNITSDPQRRRNFIKSGNGLTVASRFSVAQWYGLQQQFKRFPESYCSSRFPFVVAKAHYYEIV